MAGGAAGAGRVRAGLSLDALARLRRRACWSLFAPVSLPEAVARLGFVQADPIRAPARAQDLILRHRVRGYREGDLHRRYARLGLEEDFVHAYGFMPAGVAALLHPRPGEGVAGLAAEVLAWMRGRGVVHPRALEAAFGAERAVNAWGGFSKATTRALEALRHAGRVRVAGRVGGVRVYVAVAGGAAEVVVGERARRVVMLVAGLLAPVSAASLRGALALVERRNPGLGALAPVVAALLAEAVLGAEMVEGERYLWPAACAAVAEAPRGVRLLAPFDPVVWDRRRFAHLHGWAYRFEAYVPPARRVMGYYAMPVLWGVDAVGWANVAVSGGVVDVALGYPGRAPGGAGFRRGVEAEVARLGRFFAGRA